MKEIKAVIQPQKLGKLRNAFRQMRGFPGMTVSRVEGCSQHEEPEVSHDIREELTDFSPKVRVEIVAPDDKVDEIVGLIHAHAHTGRQGDGLVWVTDVVSAKPIRAERI
ncbi:P-II family nitrogen regulator [Methylocaldum szegediense]|uniref:Nitrogen regulatory protein P-II 1 n=1 Tax=Methylocaldum szegediense TaxID=73780 RepID=A0ABM9I1V6_9GAMM|nr:P-II family nitrogen regulator [Methylocaldum szegediense]CAI8834222.1 Nitrogen regulatory protein P-II 1 [Methylocaldum szegediense]